MRLPRFAKLQRAVASLDKEFISKRIHQMEGVLSKNGLPFEPACTAVTEEGIIYVSAEVGLATKVVLYISDQPNLATRRDQIEPPGQSGYADAALINKLHPYHIVRCNTLTHAERNGWLANYRIAQRIDGNFYCRFPTGELEDDGQTEEFQVVEDQKLYICPNCLLKVNSLFEGVHQFEKESFDLKYFFNVKYTRSWCRYDDRAEDRGTMSDMYPRDWLELCRIRMQQVNYQCEACDIDLSEPRLRKYLHLHHSDHEKGKVGYVKLECLCIACLADHPARSHLKELPDYQQYLRL